MFDNSQYSEFVYLRTYSRFLKDKERREEWKETVDRYIEHINEYLTYDDKQIIRELIYNKSIMPSMRLMQFAGEAAKRNPVCGYNCAYIAPQSLKDLSEIMYLLMSGCGVGFSVEKKVIDKLPVIAPIKGIPLNTILVNDSREGWCDAFFAGLTAWYNGLDINFDFSKIRPAGSKLLITGGRASGYKPLEDLLNFTRIIIQSANGRKLTTLEVHDIICKIGEIVVAGGVRRSALISLSDLNDSALRDCKQDGYWKYAPHRAMANNSAVYEWPHDFLSNKFDTEWNALIENKAGERGIFNRMAATNYLPDRRLAINGKDQTRLMGTNPCGEIVLRNKGLCNLSEVIIRPSDTFEIIKNKVRFATILGTIQSIYTDFKYLSSEWRTNAEEERLLGVSLTGLYDNPIMYDPANSDFLKLLRYIAQETNKEYAEFFGINRSSAITCIKPSGTVSQICDTASGMHTRFSPYYIRRVRINVHDPLLKLAINSNLVIHNEIGQQEDCTTKVIEFPIKSPAVSVCNTQRNAIQQLEYWKHYKINYTEHNPSVTIYINDNEWSMVKSWLINNKNITGGLSFLPKSDHVYMLAPYEEITKETYEEKISSIRPLDFSALREIEKEDNTNVMAEFACTGGHCEI